jgi:hypothetical protein
VLAALAAIRRVIATRRAGVPPAQQNFDFQVMPLGHGNCGIGGLAHGHRFGIAGGRAGDEAGAPALKMCH